MENSQLFLQYHFIKDFAKFAVLAIMINLCWIIGSSFLPADSSEHGFSNLARSGYLDAGTPIAAFKVI